MPDGVRDRGRVLQGRHELAADAISIADSLVSLLLCRAVAVIQHGIGIFEAQADILQGLAHAAASRDVQQADGRLRNGHGALERRYTDVLGCP
ncbi:hypothetical protein D3C72_1851300 [compost metagenome]